MFQIGSVRNGKNCANLPVCGVKSIYGRFKPYGNSLVWNLIFNFLGERYDFVITADQPVGAYWIQLRGLGECGIKRAQQLAILRYARGPYQPASPAPTYDVGIPQGVVSTGRGRWFTALKANKLVQM